MILTVVLLCISIISDVGASFYDASDYRKVLEKCLFRSFDHFDWVVCFFIGAILSVCKFKTNPC